MDAANLYLNLLEECLTRSLFIDEEVREVALDGWKLRAWDSLRRLVSHPELRLVKPVISTPEARRARAEGKGHHSEHFETSIGFARLDNIRNCVTSVLEDEIPGDLIEAGVQRGGASVFTRAVLAAHGGEDRGMWLADTFTGLPVPNPEKYPADAGYNLTGDDPNAIGVEGVKSNFRRYGLLDERVQFLVGLFKDTLPEAPIERLSVVRLDGDLYESTMDAITALYPKLSVGGYLIVDDYSAPMWSKACGQAIRDYRAEHDITEPIQEVDWTAVYWRRER
jgi:O-methyltransferase